jgi:thiamine-phosphate pyrophosphorylase
LSLQFQLPKIYPITDPYTSGISHLEQVTRLIEGGARLIQLRDKHATPAGFFTAARDCVTLARSHGVRIIVNDRVDIAKAAEADGVHLGQDDMPAVEARKILGETAIIGVSTHSDDQARESRRLPINYIAIGPVFTTDSKVDPEPVVGMDGIRSVRAVVGDMCLVAIGGINEPSLSAVLMAGADSAAIISALSRHPATMAATMRTMSSIADVSV